VVAFVAPELADAVEAAPSDTMLKDVLDGV